MRLSPDHLRGVIERALDEDLVSNDVTTRATIGDSAIYASANLVAKVPGVIAGIEAATLTFEILDPSLETDHLLQDGTRVEGGESIATVSGSAASILGAERTALNLIQRMSGIATLTDRYVTEVRGTGATIVDTRKTVPGLRLLDKYCVAVGGASNHRLNLSDGVLIKDNHIAVMRSRGMSISDIVAHAREYSPHTARLEIEVEDESEALEAIEAGADIVMLDNMPIGEMRRVVVENRKRALLEASGGITLDNVLGVAETGVDLISIGELTHSPPSLDISLEFCVG